MPSITQEFTSKVKKLKNIKQKHEEYHQVYTRLRGQRRVLLGRVRSAAPQEMPEVKRNLSLITDKMREARNRSINIIKHLSEVDEEIEEFEIVHENLDRNEFKLL